MTAAEWLGSAEPKRMLKFLGDRMTDRKCRLFACACCRRQASLLTVYAWGLRALETAERFSDGEASRAECAQADEEFDAEVEYAEVSDAAELAATALWHVMYACKDIPGAARVKSEAAAHCLATAAASARQSAGSGDWDKDRNAELRAQADLLREVVGNPFRPVIVDPGWLTPTVFALVQTIKKHQAFESMPILADALEEAGCTDDDILAHLRAPGPHARGCWAVDLILGKQ